LPLAERLALVGWACDHVLGPVAAIGAAHRAFLCRLPLELDGQLAGFWQGNHLLHVKQQPIARQVPGDEDRHGPVRDVRRSQPGHGSGISSSAASHLKNGTCQQARHGNQNPDPAAGGQEGTVKAMALPPFLAKVVSWLRAGYPDGVPEHDYIPLIALLGSQLTDHEVTLVAGELSFSANPESAQEIKKAISAITRSTVSDSDIAQVRSHLAAGGWPLAAPDRD
jgi:hypothetical protein